MKNFFQNNCRGHACFRCEGRGAPVSTAYPDGEWLGREDRNEGRARDGALATRFFVRKSDKSFNSEFGVPFTILGVENPWGNPLAWVSIMKSSLVLLILPNHYPNMLVLEAGADKQGDLARILRMATPDAVVITRLPDIPVHVEAYASPEAVREEEFSPPTNLPQARHSLSRSMTPMRLIVRCAPRHK